MFTLKVKQCCFKQHSKGEWKNNKFDLEISLLPKSKLELKKLEHFFFKMCHNLVFMERETFDTFSTLIFSTYSPGSKLNSRNLPAPITNGLEGGTWFGHIFAAVLKRRRVIFEWPAIPIAFFGFTKVQLFLFFVTFQMGVLQTKSHFVHLFVVVWRKYSFFCHQ